MTKLAFGILWATGIFFGLTFLWGAGWLIYSAIADGDLYAALAVAILCLTGATIWAINYLCNHGRL